MSDMQDPQRPAGPDDYPELFAETPRTAIEPRQRWPRIVLAGLVIAIVAGAVGWYGLKGGSMADKNAPVPLVQADQAPVKVRPEEPGGMQVPDRDKLVYERIGGDAPRPGVERLLPPPEAPLPPPAPPAVPPAASLSTETMPPAPPPLSPGPITTIPGGGGTAESLRVPPPVALPPAALPSTALPTARQGTAAVPPTPTAPALPAAPPTTAVQPVTPPALPPAPVAQPAPVAPAAAPPPPAVVASTGGSYRVQLGAVRDEQAARAEWSRLRQRHGDVLGNLELDIERADLGSRGIYFRVRGGPLADEASARRVCDVLKPRNVGCLVVK